MRAPARQRLSVVGLPERRFAVGVWAVSPPVLVAESHNAELPHAFCLAAAEEEVPEALRPGHRTLRAKSSLEGHSLPPQRPAPVKHPLEVLAHQRHAQEPAGERPRGRPAKVSVPSLQQVITAARVVPSLGSCSPPVPGIQPLEDRLLDALRKAEERGLGKHACCLLHRDGTGLFFRNKTWHPKKCLDPVVMLSRAVLARLFKLPSAAELLGVA